MTAKAKTRSGVKGSVVQVIGATLDAEFPVGELPEIYHALTISLTRDGEPFELVSEVQQHLGGNRVRAVAMASTDGLVRNMEVTDTGAPISVPVLVPVWVAPGGPSAPAAPGRTTPRW